MLQGTIGIKLKGAREEIKRLNDFNRAMLEAQFMTGRQLLAKVRIDAKATIKKLKAPKTTGTLSDGLVIREEQTSRSGTRHVLDSTAPYSRKVHSGRPISTVAVTPDLLNWVKDNLGDAAYKRIKARGTMTIGRPSGKRKYNAQVGMRFFDDPYRRLIQTAPEKYMKAVEDAKGRARLK